MKKHDKIQEDEIQGKGKAQSEKFRFKVKEEGDFA